MSMAYPTSEPKVPVERGSREQADVARTFHKSRIARCLRILRSTELKVASWQGNGPTVSRRYYRPDDVDASSGTT